MFRFGFGRVRELEEKLRIREKQLEEYRLVLRDANELQDAERNYFLKVTEERAQLAKGLAKVATESRNRKDLDHCSLQEAEQMEETLSALAKEEDDPKLAEELLLARTEAKGLLEYFREMSVLALSAAIEGQRSGEKAGRFVSVAEQIKGMAEEKGQAMEKLVSRLEGLCSLTDTLPQAGMDTQLTELLNRAKTLKNRQMQLIKSETECLGTLDRMGDRFLEDQRSAEEAEFYFRQVVREDV